jgi:hypothetical protein
MEDETGVDVACAMAAYGVDARRQVTAIERA